MTENLAHYNTITIVSDSGYENQLDGVCSPHQYSMAIAALRRAPHSSQKLLEQRDDLLAALKELVEYVDERNGDNECRQLENSIAVIQKATQK